MILVVVLPDNKTFYLRFFASILFVFLYLIAMLRPVAPMIDYYLNQDYIKAFLCINTDKPALQCNGKCYLTLQLQENAPIQKDAKGSWFVSFEKYPLAILNLSKTAVYYGFYRNKKVINFYLAMVTKTVISKLWRPPMY